MPHTTWNVPSEYKLQDMHILTEFKVPYPIPYVLEVSGVVCLPVFSKPENAQEVGYILNSEGKQCGLARCYNIEKLLWDIKNLLDGKEPQIALNIGVNKETGLVEWGIFPELEYPKEKPSNYDDPPPGN